MTTADQARARAETEGFVIAIDKPAGISSAAVVARVKKWCGLKVGHCGTLDPMATGVLPVLCGHATKISDYLTAGDKSYLATVRLGVTSDTDDITGTVVLAEGIPSFDVEQVDAACEKFRGEIVQVPPAYSAISVGGKRAYKLARAGKDVALTGRRVTIYKLDVLAVRGTEVEMSIACSKGTYIRSLARDLGLELGCGGALAALRRTMSAGLRESQTITLDDLPERGWEAALSIREVMTSIPELTVSDEVACWVRQGRKLSIEQLAVDCAQDVLILDPEGRSVAIAYRNRGESRIRYRRILIPS